MATDTVIKNGIEDEDGSNATGSMNRKYLSREEMAAAATACFRELHEAEMRNEPSEADMKTAALKKIWPRLLHVRRFPWKRLRRSTTPAAP